MGLFKDDPPPPPNYQPLADASMAQTKAADAQADRSFQLGEDQLQWAKDQAAQNQAIEQPVVAQLQNEQTVNDQNAAADRARYESEFQPVENQFVDEANSYASPARQALEMGRAGAGTAQAFDSQRTAATQQLESYGVNPASTRGAALDIGTRAQEAAAIAGSENQAYQQVNSTALGLQSQAINIGRGYPGQVQGEYQTANSGGTGAISGANATTSTAASTMGTGTQWAGVGNTALGAGTGAINAGTNALNTGFQNAETNYNTPSGWGTALGAIAGMGTGTNNSTVGGKVLGGFLGFAEGGEVPESNGQVQGAIPATASPSGGRAIDDIPAPHLNSGEFVFPRDVAAHYGTKQLYGMITKARQDMQRQANPQAIPVGGQRPQQHQNYPKQAIAA